MSTIIDEVDYGPLAQLIGTWVGNRGLDIAPDGNSNPDKTGFQMKWCLLFQVQPRMQKNKI